MLPLTCHVAQVPVRDPSTQLEGSWQHGPWLEDLCPQELVSLQQPAQGSVFAWCSPLGSQP